MVLASFQIEDKLRRARFFQKTFLVTNTYVNIIQGMPFFTLSNKDVVFKDLEFTWRVYTPAEALPTTKRVQMIDWKKFAAVAPNSTKKAFIVHMAYL